MNENLRTVVVGVGEIGRPLFNLISKAEANAVAVDIEPVQIPDDVGIMHVCYPFQLSDGFVQVTTAYAKKYRPQIIVINSTVFPGTTEETQKATGIPCVYSPIRGKHAKMREDLLTYTKFVAGNNHDAVSYVQKHFESAGLKTSTMSSPEVLELSKLLETTYFGLLIGWAQEMNRFVERFDGDYFEATKFFKEIPYLPSYVFQPGYIGGHCVISNIHLLQSVFESDFLNAVVSSNDKRAKELGGVPQSDSVRLAPLTPDTSDSLIATELPINARDA